MAEWSLLGDKHIKHACIEMLERIRIFPALDSKFGDKSYIFQQDNSPAQSAATTKQYLNSKALVMD